MDCIYQNTYELATPVGTVEILGDGRRIPFSVEKNGFDHPYGELHTETNYALFVDVDQLTVGAQYQIRFSGGALAYCDSDENTEAMAVTIDGWSVGIGAFHPNEREEAAQAWEYSRKTGKDKNTAAPFCPDESRLNGYTVRVSDDRRGFTFKLLDKSRLRVRFLVAWIRNETPDPRKYEEALGFWLT